MNIKKEVIRFSFAGLMVGAIDFGTYFGLVHFLSINVSKAIAFTVAGIVAYFLNKYFTFRHNRPRGVLSQYILVNLIALIINVIMNRVILNIFPGAVLPALVSAALSSALFTFVCFKWWVFKGARD